MKCVRCGCDYSSGAKACNNCDEPIYSRNEPVFAYEGKYVSEFVAGIIGMSIVLILGIISITLQVKSGHTNPRIFVLLGAAFMVSMTSIEIGIRPKRLIVRRNRLSIEWGQKHTEIRFDDINLNLIECENDTITVGDIKCKFKTANEAYEALCKAVSEYPSWNLY